MVQPIKGDLAEGRKGQEQEHVLFDPVPVLPEVAVALGQEEGVDGKGEAAQGPHEDIDVPTEKLVVVEQDPRVVDEHGDHSDDFEDEGGHDRASLRFEFVHA